MKKLFLFAMALVLVAFALPALAQNNINGLGSYGNSIGDNNANNQFQAAKIGDQSGSAATALNKSEITIENNGSGNTTDWDSSTDVVNKSPITVQNSFNDLGSGNGASFDDNSSGFLNKSTVTVDGFGSGNTIGNINTTLTANITAAGSLNNNTVYVGDMTNAWQFQYESAHTFDHQLDFNSTFMNTNSAAVFIPINNNHLSQANSGINAGDHAGQLTAASSNAFNSGSGSIQGMFGMSLNAGGVAQNQAAANVVTAFSRQ